MKPKPAFILFIVVAALIAGIATYKYRIEPGQKKKAESSSGLFAEFDRQAATRIEILRGSTSTVLVRDADAAWKVETKDNYPADADAVNRALEALQEMKEGILSSKNKANHDRLGVGETGLRVKVSAGSTLVCELFVGKPGKSHGTTFVRKPPNDNVYLITENLKSIFDQEGSGWRDLKIFSVKFEDVISVSLTTLPGVSTEGGSTPAEPEDTLTIRKNSGNETWGLVVSGDTVEALDKAKVDALVRSLVTLTASGFADDVSLADAGLEPPKRKAVATLANGKSYTLLVGELEESKHYVKSADRDVIQRVYQYNVGNIFKEKVDLVPAPEGEAVFDPSSMLPPPRLEKVEPNPGQE